MSDLLGIGASGIRAYGSALAAVGNNVSNASTAGYTRRTVTMTQNQSAGSNNLYYTTTPQFGGVLTTSVTRAWDDYQALAARTASADAGATGARAQWYASIESSLGDGASGVGQSVTAVFNAGDALAADVNSSANRQAFLSALDQSASAFRTTSTALAQTAAGIGQQAQMSVQTINSKLDTLDKINEGLNRAVPGSNGQANLLDQRDQLLDDLSAQVGVTIKLDDKGVATVSLASSGVQLTKSLNGANGGVRLAVAQADNGVLSIQTLSPTATTQNVGIVGGALGGLMDSATLVADRRDSLDKMAKDFVTQINAWQANGKTSAGVTGTDLLSGTSAATIKLSVNDPSAIAVQGTDGTVNGNLLKLTDLRNANGTEQRWTAMVTDQGQKVAAAKTADTAAASAKDAALQARDTASGVDLDTEAAELLRYQQAYSGAAKVIQVAKETMDSVLNLI